MRSVPRISVTRPLQTHASGVSSRYQWPENHQILSCLLPLTILLHSTWFVFVVGLYFVFVQYLYSICTAQEVRRGNARNALCFQSSRQMRHFLKLAGSPEVQIQIRVMGKKYRLGTRQIQFKSTINNHGSAGWLSPYLIFVTTIATIGCVKVFSQV